MSFTGTSSTSTSAWLASAPRMRTWVIAAATARLADGDAGNGAQGVRDRGEALVAQFLAGDHRHRRADLAGFGRRLVGVDHEFRKRGGLRERGANSGRGRQKKREPALPDAMRDMTCLRDVRLNGSRRRGRWSRRTSIDSGPDRPWPIPRDGCACHRCGKPPRARAPHAGRVTGAGRSPGSRVVTLVPPSRARAPVASGGGLAADSCGGSSGLGPLEGPHRIPSWPAREPAHLHRASSEPPRRRACQFTNRTPPQAMRAFGCYVAESSLSRAPMLTARAALPLAFIAGPALPALAADDALDAIDQARKAYQSGDLANAKQSLDLASRLIGQKNAEAFAALLPNAARRLEGRGRADDRSRLDRVRRLDGDPHLHATPRVRTSRCRSPAIPRWSRSSRRCWPTRRSPARWARSCGSATCAQSRTAQGDVQHGGRQQVPGGRHGSAPADAKLAYAQAVDVVKLAKM